VDFSVLQDAKLRVRSLAEKAGIDYTPTQHGYPHHYFIDERSTDIPGAWATYDLRGERVRQYLDYSVSTDLSSMEPGDSAGTCIVTPKGTVDGALTCVSYSEYRLSVPAAQAGLAAAWLRDLSDGYVAFDADVLKKIPGPVVVKGSSVAPVKLDYAEQPADSPWRGASKPYYIGMPKGSGKSLPDFSWEEPEAGLRRTPLYDVHKGLGAKIIPFAGWEMPVWYSSVVEEHLATRQAAGLFDVAHMGVYQAEGPHAAAFLDSVCGNEIGGLGIGDSCYTQFLDPEARVIDDTIIYRRAQEKFLVVVNASNDDKDWAWLNAVRRGEVCVDRLRPWARAYGSQVLLRNLRDPEEGDDMRVDIALQGPKSRDILLALGCDGSTRKRILALKRTELCDAVVGGFDLVVSRTGYTGEKMAFELFVHPQRAEELFNALLQVGGPMGIKPVGLGARDSLRTEAGLPLYGHEMGAGSGNLGEKDLGVAEGGFGSYVKTYKPWFIGREAYIANEKTRKGVVARFRFTEKGVRMAHNGDPVMDKRGKVIGWVTSCAVDSDGYLTGQVYLDLKNAEENTPILIYQSAPDKAGKAPAELKSGDKAALPTPAVVESRFPK